MRVLVLYLLISFCVGMCDGYAPINGKSTPQCGEHETPKYLPIALRYRQLLDQQIQLLPCLTSCLSAGASASASPRDQSGESDATLRTGTLISYLLLRLQF